MSHRCSKHGEKLALYLVSDENYAFPSGNSGLQKIQPWIFQPLFFNPEQNPWIIQIWKKISV